jgi:four helix bundle protein
MSTWRAEFTRLKAWQLAYDVGLEIYKLAARFPHPHLFSLGSQLSRAAVSLSTNIAEGYGRRAARDKAHFYVIAHSSAEELKNLLFFARDLCLIDEPRVESLLSRVDESSRILHGLIEAMDSWRNP